MAHPTRTSPRMIIHALAAAASLFLMPAPAAAVQPPQIQRTGVVRDFRAYGDPGGHPTMERPNMPGPIGPRWVISNRVHPKLGIDGNPVFTNNGIVVKTAWKDAAGRNIAMQLPPKADDVPGLVTNAWNDYLDTATFPDLFNDVPGVNMSVSKTLTFDLQADGTYLYDAKTDPSMPNSPRGFFPIDSQLYGNYSGGGGHNFHFTFELRGQFIYDAAAGQIFEFNGDDDVWVFINGRLVVDLGGRHSAKSMFVDMNRLGLTDGEIYRLDFFLMERRTNNSNCVITTNLPLEATGTEVMVSAPFD